MPRRTRPWLALLAGLALLAACHRDRRDDCRRFADAVVECCPDQSHADHLGQCVLDTRSGDIACDQAGRALYDCFESAACDDACTLTPRSCAQEYQSFVNTCSQTP